METFEVRVKPKKRSFYKSISIISLFAVVCVLQISLSGRGENEIQKHIPRNTSLSQRKLLQTEEQEIPPYCEGGSKGTPFDPVCPCDPVVDDQCWCPVVENIAYNEWPCGWDVICQNIVYFNESDRCNFTKTTSYCAILEGFINYNQVVYCDFGDLIPLIMVILTIWWIFLFVSLAVCADDFFCTALVIIVKTLNLSPNVAGVTFLAFGNGAPDLFSAIAAFLAMKAGDAGLAIGGLYGAGIFVTTIIVGAVAVIKPFKVPERPFLRDDIFYLGGAFWMLWIIWRERIYLYDAVGFVLLYIVYVLVVILSGSVNRRLMGEGEEGGGKGSREVPAADKQESTKKTTERKRLSAIDFEGTIFTGFQLKEDALPSSASYVTLDNFNGTKPTVEYDNLGFSNDRSAVENGSSSQANGSAPRSNGVQPERNNETQDEKQARLQELGRMISMEIEAEREVFRTTSFIGDDDEDKKSEEEYEKLPPWKQFLTGINPINVAEWSDMPWYLKIYEVFKSPIMFLLTLTVPVVNYEVEPTHNWNRYLQCFQCMISPMFCAFLIGSGTMPIADSSIQIWVPLLVVGFILAVIVFFLTEDYKIPRFHEAFGYMAFGVAMVWIYAIATEIVNLLTAFGVVLQLSNGILGLTLLAWGNSVGDFVADYVMAKQGFPRMAFSACFGAPIFHLCLGTGIPFIARMAADEVTFMKINLDTMLLMANLAVIVSMIFSLIALLLTKFKANKPYGMCLVIFYIVFVIIAILTEAGVIPAEIESHEDR